MTECIQKDHKLTKYSPGCGGRVEYPPGLLEMNPKTKRFRNVKGKSCRLHYLESAFGLAALECPQCKKLDKDYRDRIQAKSDAALDEDDMSKYTYVDTCILFAPARRTWFLKKHVPAFTVKCWNCGFVFMKGRKATKAEREKNEREGWKQIPEASPQLKKIIEKSKKL